MGSNSAEQVNTFWHGGPLPPIVRMCLGSFGHYKIGVNLFCYEHLEVPSNVCVCDAEEIVPRSRVFSYQTGPGAGSVAAFSNLFRYKLLFERGGWWVDGDVACLRPLPTESELMFGWEDERNFGTAVLRVPKGHELAAALSSRANAIVNRRGSDLSWGEIGPQLFTSTVKDLGLTAHAAAADAFFPIHYADADYLVRPHKLAYVQSAVSNSYTVHLWHEMFRRQRISTAATPPVGCYLHALFQRYDDGHPLAPSANGSAPNSNEPARASGDCADQTTFGSADGESTSGLSLYRFANDALEQRLRDAKSALLKANLALDESKSLLLQKDEELVLREAAFSALDAVAQTQNSLISSFNGIIQDREAQLAKRDAAIEVAQQSSLTAQQNTKQIWAWFHEHQNALVTAHGELNKHSIALKDAYRQITHLTNQILQREQQLEQFRSSTCWRITSPLRSGVIQTIYRPLLASLKAISTNVLERRYEQDSPAKPSAIAERREDRITSGRVVRLVIISGEPNTPGHVYRVERLASAARTIGIQPFIVRSDELSNELSLLGSANIIVIWRMAWSDLLSRITKTARSRGAALIFDVDDHMIDPRLARPEIIDGINSLSLDSAEVAQLYAKILQTFTNCDFGMAPTSSLAHEMRAHQKPVFLLPNGFDEATLSASRRAVRMRQAYDHDGIVRLGYAAGTRTHQRDFALVSRAIARVLKEKHNARLVLFSHQSEPVLNLADFREFRHLHDRVEWRELVPLTELPKELARFSINVAPVEVGNAFCEAKSELKFFEAALVEVPTIASPTEPFRQAIKDNVTGILAGSEDEWYAAVSTLVENVKRRTELATAAYHDVVWKYGPERRAELLLSIIDQVQHRGSRAARSFALSTLASQNEAASPPNVTESVVLFKADTFQESKVTVVIPLFNYARYVEEALDSVRAQTLNDLDLVVVDDCSTDQSVEVASSWIERNRQRFNRVVLARNKSNVGLARTRNVGFLHAESLFVLPLDADNLLLPNCAAMSLLMLERTDAAFAFPGIQTFGDREELIGCFEFDPLRFMGGNYIDAMALVRKSAWARVGGYDAIPFGWEDYDFWCKCVEHRLWGVRIPEILAKYRAHSGSMLNTTTDIEDNKRIVIDELERRHPWIRLRRN